MKTDRLAIRVTFTEPVLGSASGNPQIHEEFIAAKAAKDAGPRKDDAVTHAAEEVKAVTPLTEEQIEEQIEAKSTIFPVDKKGLFIWDYAVRGMIKEALRTLIDLGESKISKWQYRRVIDSTLFAYPRKLYLHMPDSNSIWQAPTDTLQRSLRVNTLQGERIALANSQRLPAGTWFEAELELLLPAEKSNPQLLTMKLVKECLDYGKYKGKLQWRSGGFGKFSYREIK